MLLTKPVRAMRVNTTHPLSRGLTAAFLFNEEAGNLAFDSVSYRTATLTNATRAVEGIQVDASGERITYTRSGIISSKGSIALWLYTLGAPPAFARLFAAEGGGNFFVRRTANDAVIFEINGSAPTLSSSKAIWYGYDRFIVVTWDDDANIRQLFVDGVLEDTAADAFSFGAASTSLEILNRADGAQYANAIGKLFYLWNRVLSAPEVNHLFLDPFCFFDQPLSPALLVPISGQVVTLAGSTLGQSSTSATSKVLRELISSALTASITAATLKAVRGLGGSLDASSSVAATAKAIRKIAGESAGLSTTSALIKLVREVVGSSATTTQLAAALKAERTIAASIGALSSTAAAVQLAIALAGSLAANGDTAGTVKLLRQIIGQLEANSNVIGELTEVTGFQPAWADQTNIFLGAD